MGINLSDPTSTSREPLRVLGPVSAFAVVAGSMLGVGIFLFPGKVAFALPPSVLLFFLLWLAGGLFALSGAVACGELGAMFPRCGGDYVFQREAMGPSVAFASGWVLFVAIFCGSIAGMSVAVFQYQVSQLTGVSLAQLRPIDALPVSLAQLLAVALILGLTGINHVGARLSAAAQVLLTLTPIAALTLLSLYVLGASPVPQTPMVLNKEGATVLTLGGLAAAFLYVNFAFSGWINIIYVAGEVRDPHRTIPRSMITATLAVTALYVLLLLAFLSVLGLSGLSALGWTDAGTGMSRALGIPGMETLLLILIAVAIVTSVNATVLSSARVAFAMSTTGAFWSKASVLSGPGKVPRNALWLQAALASIFVLTGTFEEIIKMASVAMLITGTLTVLSMFVLRRTRKTTPRPYRATGYPVLPGLYVLFSVGIIAVTLQSDYARGGADFYYPMIGLGILLAAGLQHRYRNRSR